MSDKVSILENLKSPSDVRTMSDSQLELLCSEIRKTLIDTVASTGGHLASNLGTVELTVALHKSFNSPDDKIIWDVGHQAYAHKLLTGRYSSFLTLRTENGISGFVRPYESEHDSFYEGHAGVSVSQAAGIAAANAVNGSENFAVAVIGDGAFGNGMVYEAMNHAGSAQTKLIVILNDNEMSISENVGAMARHFAKSPSNPEYCRVKNAVYPSRFFEDLGFQYIGPVDGHNINSLCEAMDSAKTISAPVVIHVNTVKGRGYDFAESSPEKFHGISKFDINTGEQLSSEATFSSYFGKTLCELASKDSRICAITAAMSIGTGLDEFSKTYPERFFDVGIAEEHAVTFASGLSAGGMIPVFAVYSTFLQRCADQLIHDGALQKRKMIIAVDRAGFVGEDGETHQGLFDVSLVQSIPNTTVYSPSTYGELANAMYNAVYKDENLVIIRYPREYAPEGETNGADYEVSGSGEDTAIVTYGRLYFNALKAAEMLAEKGIKTKLIKLCKIKPLSEIAVSEAAKCKKIFFFEEGMRSGGTGETMASELLGNGFSGKYVLTAVDNEFVTHASVSSLLDKYSMSAEKMYEIILNEVEQ